MFYGVPQGSILGPIMFLVFFNDFPEYLSHCEVVKFADDTVIYVSGDNLETIEDKLSKDLTSISNFFDENDLIINLKKGKTESMLFGTARKVNKNIDGLQLRFKHQKLHSTNAYKYLGVRLYPTLSFNDHFNTLYKKASSRIRLMHRLNKHLTAKASLSVYQSVVVPLLTYCGVVNINLSNTQIKKLQSLESRAIEIIQLCNTNYDIFKVSSIHNTIKKRACTLVYECLHGNLCSNFRNYFELMNHGKATRNNKINVKLPRVKLCVARNSFYYMSAKLYNNLPSHIKSTRCKQSFKKQIDLFYR